MKFPNKIFSYKESVLYHMEILLLEINKNTNINCLDLFNKTKSKISSIKDFTDALVCLYSLGAITLDTKTKEISYALSN